MTGTATAGAVDGLGAGTALAFDDTFPAAGIAVLVRAAALRADELTGAAAGGATDALAPIAEKAVSPAASPAEAAVVGNLAGTLAAGAFTVGDDSTGKCQATHQHQKRR